MNNDTFQIEVGKAARMIRARTGLSCARMGEIVGLFAVDLQAVEEGVVSVPASTLRRFRERWGIDPHSLAWCLVNHVPESVIRDAVGIDLPLRHAIINELQSRAAAAAQ